MDTQAPDLGSHLGTHRAAGGFTGFQNRKFGRTLLLTIAGLFLGFVPGLIVALIADLWPALIVGPVLGAGVAFLLARRMTFEAAVTEARLHERGVVFVDGRGTHALGWDEISTIQGRHVQTVAGTPLGDIKGATLHTYAVGTRAGIVFWLDDRVENVVALADSLARAAGVPVTPMA